jgi:hypothetical protein
MLHQITTLRLGMVVLGIGSSEVGRGRERLNSGIRRGGIGSVGWQTGDDIVITPGHFDDTEPWKTWRVPC